MAERAPSEAIMDSVDWRVLPPPDVGTPDELYATHEGKMEIGDITLRCYQLNDGRRILDAEDVHKYFFPDEAAGEGSK
jgi:hypothetical protein